MENMPVIYDIDVVTGLPLFMLAAVWLNSDIELTYRLLRDNAFVCPSHVVTEEVYYNRKHKRARCDILY